VTTRLEIEAGREQELDPEEEQAIHEDVQWDRRAGQGAKHFDDILSEVLDNPSRTHEGEAELATAERERVMYAELEMLRSLHLEVQRALGEHGFTILEARHAGDGRGWVVKAQDQWRIQYTVDLTYDGMLGMGEVDRLALFPRVVDLVCRELLSERARRIPILNVGSA
jgi:hypothetical protein